LQVDIYDFLQIEEGMWDASGHFFEKDPIYDIEDNCVLILPSSLYNHEDMIVDAPLNLPIILPQSYSGHMYFEHDEPALVDSVEYDCGDEQPSPQVSPC